MQLKHVCKQKYALHKNTNKVRGSKQNGCLWWGGEGKGIRQI